MDVEGGLGGLEVNVEIVVVGGSRRRCVSSTVTGLGGVSE